MPLCTRLPTLQSLGLDEFTDGPVTELDDVLFPLVTRYDLVFLLNLGAKVVHIETNSL